MSLKNTTSQFGSPGQRRSALDFVWETVPAWCLPENPHQIASDLWIRSHHREAASKRLTDQDAIERVTMQGWQARDPHFL